jgi:hypothetical protein
MISDDPGEDADTLDDETLMQEYLGVRPEAATGSVAAMPDWPPVSRGAVRLDLDAATIDWFRDRHADWRKQMGFVLRAWVAAHGRD